MLTRALVGITLQSLDALGGAVSLPQFRLLLAASAGYGLATLALAQSPALVTALAAGLLVGACDAMATTIRQAAVQLETPDAMRGRVNAINSLFIGTSNQLGEFESGMLASLVGPVWAVALGGLGTIGIVLLWTRLFPALPKVQTFHEN